MNANNPAAQPFQTGAASGLVLSQPKLMYSKVEAAEILSLGVRTIDYLIAGGELAVRRVGRRVLVPYSAIVQFSRRDHVTGRVQ